MISWLKYFLFFVFGSLLIVGCGSKKGAKSNNYSYLYQRNLSVLKPQFRIYHTSADSMRVYFKIDKENLLFMRDQESQEFKAQLRVRYALIKSYNHPELLDSSSFTIDHIAQGQGFIQSHFSLKSSLLRNHPKAILAVSVEDFNRRYEYTSYLKIATEKGEGAQSYLPVDTLGNVIFENYILLGTPIQINHPSEGFRPIQVFYYNRDIPLALPPFSQKQAEEFNFTPDSTFMISQLEVWKPEKTGIYFFTQDPAGKLGFTMQVYADDYPLITKKHQLTEPMRYITTKKEYEYLSEIPDPDTMKYRADEFWLTRVGSVERGKALVSAYYNRVVDANYLFSTYAEGWKTDRGLIYIVFGEPTYTYRTDQAEIWIYGDENSALQYRFDFEKVPHPFTLDEYQLVRNGNYKYLWSQAIDAWRNGRIYNVRDIKREQDERDQQIRYQRQPYFWY